MGGWETAKADVDAAVLANLEASKVRKPQSLDTRKLANIKGKNIKLLKTLALPPAPKSNKIQGISWAPPGPHENRIGFARQDHFVGIIDVRRNCGVYGCKSPWSQCVALHPTEDVILTGGMSNATTMWKQADLQGRLQEVAKMSEHDGYISSLHFLGSDGKQYLSSSGDSDVRMFDVERRASIMRMCGHEKDAQSITFAHDDSKRFATCSSDKTVKLWDLTSGKCTHTFQTDSELNACSLFPNGNMIAAGGEKDKTYVFDVRAYALVSKYARNNQKTASIAWSKSGRHLYVGHDDGALITWDIFASGENKAYASKIEAHTIKNGDGKPDVTNSRVQQLSTNADGVLASCGFDGNVCIWTASDD